MLREEFASEANGRGERLAARIVTQFLLRYCSAMARLADGDLLRGLIIAAILDANLAHLIDPEAGNKKFGGLDVVMPDEMRAPVTVSALSRRLNIPYETVRRHVAHMIEEGACVRTDRGVYVPASWIAPRRHVTAALYSSLRRLLVTLDDTGFDVTAMARTPLSKEELDSLRL